MKISAASLFLLATGASAFTQAPGFVRPSTAVNSYLDNMGNSPGLQTTEGSLANTQRALENRLAGLEKGKVERRSMQDLDSIVLIQGGSLKTWSYASTAVDRVQVVLTTEGRPLDADVELWQGPDNTPCKMRVYSEDGSTRPFNCVIETPRGPNTVAIRNIGQIEFPLGAEITANDTEEPIADFRATSMTVQGGALRTYPFDPSVESVEITLKTDGRPLNSRIELLQGPNNNKQVIELYTEDGLDRPFFCILETMGSGNVVRVVNTAPVEFPLTASVQPHIIDDTISGTEAVIGGDSGW